MKNNDIEQQQAASESTPLVGNNNGPPRASPGSTSSVDSDTLNTSVTTTDSSFIDDITKDELDKPWPATFDRGIHILAGPVMDEKLVDDFTKSPSVRNRYKVREFIRYVHKRYTYEYVLQSMHTSCAFPFFPSHYLTAMLSLILFIYYYKNTNRIFIKETRRRYRNHRHHLLS